STPAPAPATQPNPQPPKPSLTRMDGFIPLRWDPAQGKLLMEISRFGEELIYGVSLASGVGSNPIGLDRGQLANTRIIRFERVGPRVLMIEPNYRFRAISNDPAERRAVEESFAQSVLAGFTVMSEENGAVLVDATDFFLSDQHGISRRLREAQQGGYSVDRNRSAIHLPRTKAFPRNSEVEALLTFTTNERAGNLVRSVTPTPEAVTIRQRHSFVALPEPGYKPRRLDPRVGVFGIEFYDYASPFTGPLEKRWAVRHRLEKKDPGAAVSEPVEPIIYYVDNGVPEPIRSALVEGAQWWARAFEAAGFRNAYEVRVLPPDADPQDVRYNMIHWVHRSTRGWSYGDSVIDPRTGEILKGNVLLGSLRIRQDVMLAQGLIAQFDELRDEALSSFDPKTSPSIMALQRIRQLSAHEVGHTLGLDHNMAASIYGRASVMDYPAPYVKIVDGKLDLSEAYTNSVGPYDIWAIRYAYQQFAPGANEDAELNRIAREALLFVQDSHSRPLSGAHPLGSVWDNGGDPVAMLRHEIEVRRIALEQFGLRNLAIGEPLSNLEEKLLPLYLHHRYQLEAAVKSVGGLYFSYAVKDEGGVSPKEIRRVVPAKEQREALAAVLSTLDPKFLAIPQRIVDLIPPQAYNSGTERSELFDSRTDPAFDPISAATTAADLTISALLEPHRGARLVQYHAENRENPSLREVHDALLDRAMQSGIYSRATRTLLVTRLVQLAQNRDADPQVRAEASDALRRLSARLQASVSDASEAAHRRATRDDIERFLARPAEPWQPANVPPIPPGPPI
ncbi:MAG TPA: zinc-dependent metalloprotease, partial [Thermoanaerobaculia bacterium]